MSEDAKMWVYGALWAVLIAAFAYTLRKHKSRSGKGALVTESSPG
ncbi:hypothetical protein [Calditerricola satsumensis]|nr:hypothetical protein [Calditerricola satsumensis]